MWNAYLFYAIIMEREKIERDCVCYFILLFIILPTTFQSYDIYYYVLCSKV